MNTSTMVRSKATRGRAVRQLAVVYAVMVALVGAAGSPLVAQAPTLGELAKKEQDRRKTVKATGKVFSNKDLPKAPAPADATAGLPPATTPAAAAPDAVKAEKSEEKGEAWWRARMVQAREAQRRGEAFAEALQSRINALSTDAVNRDDPFQRAKAAEDRQKAVAELGRVTAETDAAKKEIVAIEEEARQGGVPPGWLR
jgi:hypothetical protein